MPAKKTAKKIVRKSTKKTARKKVAKTSVKSVARRATKKTSARKTVRSKKEVRVMVCANEECSFWTTDGQILNDLNSLLSAFEIMSDDVYAHHVTKEKNDFAEWVEYVLDDPSCANDLRKSKKPATAKKVVVKHLSLYT